MNYTNFIYNIRVIRMSQGITAKELSEKSGCRQLKRISDIEDGRGKPNIDEIVIICKLFGVKIDQMINDRVKVKYLWNNE